MREGSFFSESVFSADCLTVSVQPPHKNINANVKNPKHWPIPLLEPTKILHTLTGKGSTALAAAVPYPGKATRISRKGQRSTKTKIVS